MLKNPSTISRTAFALPGVKPGTKRLCMPICCLQESLGLLQWLWPINSISTSISTVWNHWLPDVLRFILFHRQIFHLLYFSCLKILFSTCTSWKSGYAGFLPCWNQDCELVSQLPIFTIFYHNYISYVSLLQVIIKKISFVSHPPTSQS